jgi:hypothetical protein
VGHVVNDFGEKFGDVHGGSVEPGGRTGVVGLLGEWARTTALLKALAFVTR